MDISIIIVNYNSFNLLENCLSSITLYSKNFSYEIIIIDNASDGNIESVTNKFSNINLIKNSDNKGFGPANNQGIEKAKGKYILFLNNDTLFKNNIIKELLEIIKSIKDEVIIGCKLLNPDGSIQNSISQFPNMWNTFTENFYLSKLFPKIKLFNKWYKNYINLISPVEVDTIKGAFMLTKSTTMQKLSGFDERFYFYSEEIDLCKRLKVIGGKIYYCNNVSIVHLENYNTKRNNWFYHKNLSVGKIQFYQKYFKSFKYTSILIIHYLGIVLRAILFLMFSILSLNKRLFRKSKIYFKLLFIYPQNKFLKEI